MSRRLVALVLALGVLAPSVATAATLSPSQWPGEIGLGSSPNAIRFGGSDRYATSLAMTLALRGAGGYPFDTADRTSGGATSLAEADGWWGAATCPSSVIVVAGDTAADALAAAPLSDPTNRSDQPRLQRVAAADPLFDPIGGFDRVDTFAAPIIVTLSGRSGAHGLAASARAAASDVAKGGCTRAREAIIVGGAAAVPVEVEGELVSLGYEEVFRVAGTDRFDTAARIATALGTEAPPAGEDCDDEQVDDATAMGFYGNAVIEYRPDASSCELHGRAVVLADGSVGADALAAGWWTSYWQVPVLLVAGDGSLPSATRTALQTMSIDTIVILGGTGRIPEAVVNQATQLAGAVAGRFAGQDRYETSAIMAQVFGGWYPVDPDAFAGDRLCVAASTGATVGWPDALAAGPWCGRLSAASSSVASPSRSLEPVERADGALPAINPAHDAAPIVLVPARASQPSPRVSQLLAGAFSADAGWCGSDTATGCRPPGFAIAFGGRAVISDALLGAVSTAVAGGDSAQAGATPVLRDPFRTTLDLAPVYDLRGSGGDATGCVERGSLTAARWLAVYADPGLERFLSAVDVAAVAAYDVDGASRPLCVRLGADPATTRAVVAMGSSGRATAPRLLHGDREHTTTMSASMHHPGPVSVSGEPGTSLLAGATTSWRFDDAPTSSLDLRKRTETTHVQHASADLFLTRGRDGAPHRFVAEVAVDDGADGLAGEATGEAILANGAWELAGRFRLPSASGGFRATLDTRGTPDNDDDVLTWRVDAAAP
jgi:putative cell wall-binding protein